MGYKRIGGVNMWFMLIEDYRKGEIIIKSIPNNRNIQKLIKEWGYKEKNVKYMPFKKLKIDLQS